MTSPTDPILPFHDEGVDGGVEKLERAEASDAPPWYSLVGGDTWRSGRALTVVGEARRRLVSVAMTAMVVL